MSINTITTEDLRRMEGKDGLILQGCGGDAQEWVDGINEMFTEAGILKDGSEVPGRFRFRVRMMLTCLLYPFRGCAASEIGKLRHVAVAEPVRLSAGTGGGALTLCRTVWAGLSGSLAPEPEKPDCALIGQDGNIFNLVGIAARTLRGA